MAWSAEDFARFFNQSLDLLCIAGFDGRFKYLNPAWTTCLGWSVKELMSAPFLDWVHPDDRTATLAEVATLGEGIETICFENRYRHKNGDYRWLQWNSRHSLKDSLMFATARDVTPQKLLEQEIIRIADGERERLGRELHDGLCQTLAGVAALSTKLSRGLAATGDPVSSATASEITRLLNESIRTARDLARGLSPVDIDEMGLGAMLKKLALNVRQMFGVSCALTQDPSFRGLHSETEAQLFRIAQEAVNNSVKHGRAARIGISLACRDGLGVLTVEDNGTGLPEGARRSGGLGLRNMEYRARLIGASLKLERRARGGTTVSCAFPIAPHGPAAENPDHARGRL